MPATDPTTSAVAAPAAGALPPLPDAVGAAPAPAVAAEPTPVPTLPTAEPAPAPAPEDLPAPPSTTTPAQATATPGPQADDPVGRQRRPFSPSVEEEIAIVARRQEEESRIRQAEVAQLPGGRTAPGAVSPPPAAAGMPDLPPAPGGDSGGLSGPTGVNASTRFELQRAPSPTEVIPIRRIPIPEEFVPLPPREFQAMRKYWTAPSVCHMPLYFQDAALERYGHSVENFFGTSGRFLTYPIDDPSQSKQRFQILQPAFSAGLMAFQVGMLPYNLIVDPPWEAEYDLGYYRPGDRVPTDVFYLPYTGVGPPLHGKNY